MRLFDQTYVFDQRCVSLTKDEVFGQRYGAAFISKFSKYLPPLPAIHHPLSTIPSIHNLPFQSLFTIHYHHPIYYCIRYIVDIKQWMAGME